VGDKIEIELEGGQIKRVRPKDIKLLHPGPLSSLADLGPREGELTEAWELLERDETTLGEVDALALEKALLQFEICASDETLAELETVLMRPKLDLMSGPTYDGNSLPDSGKG
jgi:hypothetical protein